MDPTDNEISEGGGKWHKTLNTPFVDGARPTEGGQYSGEANKSAEGGPCNTHVVPATANQGNLNNYGTMEEMAWVYMGQDEVQYQLNDYDTSDIVEI